ncbi:MAG TPA: nucleotidyltransferase family protein [Bacillota bacterium]|nr:nucleotidyltransferase family protein [Bacillota bacterium]HPE38297.1 nucleotidyltransferase family protein [Bacillota bacterium]
MRVAGIIAEYNPFHYGHLYQIKEIRRRLGEETPVVVFMSGTFTQRGEPALASPWLRAEAALRLGVDLVIEMPFSFSTASADRFAAGGVALMAASSVVTDLCCGTETENISLLETIARARFDERTSFNEDVIRAQKQGLSYAAAWTEAAKKCICADPSVAPHVAELSDMLRTPNNVLALSYLKALERIPDSTIQPLMIPRAGQGFHDAQLSADSFSSASAIRRTVYQSQNKDGSISPSAIANALSGHVPTQMLAPLLASWQTARPLFVEDIWEKAYFLLRTRSVDELSGIAHMGEPLARHLINATAAIRNPGDARLADVMTAAFDTKCFPNTRISRALLSLVIGQTQEDISMLTSPSYLRILGFSEKGRDLLRRMRKEATLPIISRASDFTPYLTKDSMLARSYEIDRVAHDLWSFMSQGTWDTDFHREVIKIRQKKAR